MSTANDNADVSPPFVEFRPGMRKRVAAAVHALVALLDQIDGDQSGMRLGCAARLAGRGRRTFARMDWQRAWPS